MAASMLPRSVRRACYRPVTITIKDQDRHILERCQVGRIVGQRGGRDPVVTRRAQPFLHDVIAAGRPTAEPAAPIGAGSRCRH